MSAAKKGTRRRAAARNSIGLLIAVARDMERDLIVSAIRGCALECRDGENADDERAIREALRDLADRIERGEIARGES